MEKTYIFISVKTKQIVVKDFIIDLTKSVIQIVTVLKVTVSNLDKKNSNMKKK